MTCDRVLDLLMTEPVARFLEVSGHLEHCAQCRSIADRITVADADMAAEALRFVSARSFDAAWSQVEPGAQPVPSRSRSTPGGVMAVVGSSLQASLVTLAAAAALALALGGRSRDVTPEPSAAAPVDSVAATVERQFVTVDLALRGAEGGQLYVDGVHRGGLLQQTLAVGMHKVEVRCKGTPVFHESVAVVPSAGEIGRLALDEWRRTTSIMSGNDVERTCMPQRPSAAERVVEAMVFLSGAAGCDLFVDARSTEMLMPASVRVVAGKHLFEVQCQDETRFTGWVDVQPSSRGMTKVWLDEWVTQGPPESAPHR